MNIHKIINGQAMIEAIVAFAIVAVVLVALLRLSGQSVNNSGSASRQAQATNYAIEGMEWVKQLKLVHNWEFLKGNTGAWCINDLIESSLSYPASCNEGDTIDGTEFTRHLELGWTNEGGKQVVTAKVIVFWEEAGRISKAEQTYAFVFR